jgi:hypothetical protein
MVGVAAAVNRGAAIAPQNAEAQANTTGRGEYRAKEVKAARKEIAAAIGTRTPAQDVHRDG